MGNTDRTIICDNRIPQGWIVCESTELFELLQETYDPEVHSKLVADA